MIVDDIFLPSTEKVLTASIFITVDILKFHLMLMVSKFWHIQAICVLIWWFCELDGLWNNILPKFSQGFSTKRWTGTARSELAMRRPPLTKNCNIQNGATCLDILSIEWVTCFNLQFRLNSNEGEPRACRSTLLLWHNWWGRSQSSASSKAARKRCLKIYLKYLKISKSRVEV